MKKAALPIIIVLALLGTATAITLKPQAQTTTMPASQGTQANTAITTPSTITAASYTDGGFTGSAVDVGYGIVQVKVTVTGGKITDVKALQLPNDRPHSVEVSNYSAPILRQEAIAAQSANIDFVSGATSTSEGYQTSLQKALDLARA